MNSINMKTFNLIGLFIKDTYNIYILHLYLVIHFVCCISLTFQGIIFLISVKIYRVVLARIPIENMADIIGLYLYIDEKKALSYFLPIDEKIG
jgi:hypothetical protein